MWTERTPVAVPWDLIIEANHLAAVIDPDVGGALTFSADRTVGGYAIARIQFYSDFLPLIERRDPDEWYAVMTEIAEARGRELLTREEIEALCSSMKIGDEVEQLEVME